MIANKSVSFLQKCMVTQNMRMMSSGSASIKSRFEEAYATKQAAFAARFVYRLCVIAVE